MKFLSKMRTSVAVLGALVLGSLSTGAVAAIDPLVTAAIADAQADVISYLGTLTVAAVAIMAGYWVYRMFKSR